MSITKPLSPRSLANRRARFIQLYGQADPRTVQAARDLSAAKALIALAAARREGLDNTDLMALVKTGRLPAEAAAA